MFYSFRDSIDGEVNEYLTTTRKLDSRECVNCGIAGYNGLIYYDYRRDGRTVRIKTRSIHDKKKQQWLDESNGEPLPFFNMTPPDGINSHENSPSLRCLIITEGELDCVTLSQLRVCKCVSLHGGAGSVEKCIKDNAQYLTQFDEIYIAFDMDEAGQKAADKARSLIDPKKYRRINFPKGSKDANEWFINEEPVTDDLLRLMQNAEKLSCPEIVHWKDLPDNINDEVDHGISTGWRNLDKILGGIRPGEVTVVSADTASGKTTWCINQMVNIAKQGHAVWINSYEMSVRIVYRKAASHFLNDHMKWKNFDDSQKLKMEHFRNHYDIYINPSHSKPDLASIARQLELCSYVYNIKYILLDHFDYIYSTVKKSNTIDQINESIQQLHDMAMRYGVHIFLVAHPRQFDPTKDKLNMSFIKGSSSIKQYADNVLLLHRLSRETKKEDSPTDMRTKVEIAKNRFFGTEGKVFLTYEPSYDGFSQTLEPFDKIQKLELEESKEF